MKGKISLVIPAHNEEKTIRLCLESVLSQKNFGKYVREIIVVDDCSSDSTQEILQEYRKHIKIIRNKKNLGLAKTMNAGISQVMESEQKPHLCFDYNVKGTYNVIDACIKSGAKLIFSSSREVYGDIEGASAHEDSPINPKSNYGISKSLGESMIKFYGKKSSLNYTIFRIANVIGKRDFGRVAPIFIEKCKSNEPIMIYGGKQVLDFVYISDVVAALKKAGNLKNEIVNLGSGKGTSIEELALKIKKFTSSNSEIIYAKERSEETQRFVATISKARKLLDWEPKIGLDEALKKIIG